MHPHTRPAHFIYEILSSHHPGRFTSTKPYIFALFPTLSFALFPSALARSPRSLCQPRSTADSLFFSILILHRYQPPGRSGHSWRRDSAISALDSRTTAGPSQLTEQIEILREFRAPSASIMATNFAFYHQNTHSNAWKSRVSQTYAFTDTFYPGIHKEECLQRESLSNDIIQTLPLIST